ncbi:MAG: hypothetical protein A2Y15_00475 [Clostridiales bacterium GWF2_36_10]|nr:MAG: hypothetical protein A2Y15_00475 [Clostridiales bacterium GWF2_36_10]HAN21734.1 hypothetical protein [Clostridiales bacterium]
MSLLIGISGCSACGKSTFTKILAEKLTDIKVRVINSDTFFINPKPKMVSPLNGKLYDDFNSPETLNINEMMLEVDKALGENDIVIVEGVLIYCFKEFRSKADLKIFIDANIEARISRRLVRNTRVYGMNFDDVLEFYMNSARFSEKKNTELSKIYADIIINGEGDFEKPVQVITEYIKTLVK